MPAYKRKVVKQSAVDVSASGSGGWMDMKDAALRGGVFGAKLTALAGGSSPQVVFSLEHSPDKSAVFTLAADYATLDAADQVGQKRETSAVSRFVRHVWVTTGSPSTATADLYGEG